MGFSGKATKITSIVAMLCIAAYIIAIAAGVIRIVTNMGERRNLAEIEFNDLADRATSSSFFLGFLSEAYRQTIRDYLGASETLSGVIITGTNGEYAFERQSGNTITWINGSPRFKTGLVFSGGPLYLPLRIDGQRNVTIQAVYSYLDYNLFQKTLRDILLIVLSALVVAFLTLLLEIFLKKKAGQPIVSEAPGGEAPWSDDPGSFDLDTSVFEEPAWDEAPVTEDSRDADRLTLELHRCASSQSDLVFLAMKWRDEKTTGDRQYSLFVDEAVNFFKKRDLVFNKGKNGITVIMPNTDLEQGISQAGEFHRNIGAKLPASNEEALCIGLSSRSGRSIDAGRLMLEASSALEKALADPLSCVIAFKSDPEKYRAFIKNRG